MDQNASEPLRSPLAAESDLAVAPVPSTPPRRASSGSGHPASPRSAHAPQETLAVRRFKAASRLSPSLRPTRSADDGQVFGGAETGSPNASNDPRDLGSIVRPAPHHSKSLDDASLAASAAPSSSSSTFGGSGGVFTFPTPSPTRPFFDRGSSVSSSSSVAPVSPLLLCFTLKSEAASPPPQSTITGTDVPGVLVRAATDEQVPQVKDSSKAGDESPVAGALRGRSPSTGQTSPLPSPSAPLRSPSHNGYKPALPSPLSTSHTSVSTDLGPKMRRIAEEFPFPASPSTPGFDYPGNGTPRPASPPTPIAPRLNDSPPQPALPRHLQQSSPTPPPPVARRTRSISGELHSSPTRSSPGHWRSASTTSPANGHIFATYEPAPLTPPESMGAGRHLTSASDVAWNEVLGPIGSLSFTGIDYSLGESRDGSGKSSIVHVEDLMALEEETPAPVRALPLGRKSNAAGTSPPASAKQAVSSSALMLGTAGGHFGPATRERLATVIEKHMGRIPVGSQDEVVHIVEYGALNSRSASLVPPVVSHLASRHAALPSSGPPGDDGLSFQVTHADKVGSDFRPLSQTLESSDSSYLAASWLSAHDPPLENKVFSAFASRPFAAKVLPRASVSFGFSAMALHWLSTDRKYQMPPSTLAHGELMAFLSSRAAEFKTGGLLALAYIGRSETARPASPPAVPGLLSRGTSLNLGSSTSNCVGSMSTPGTPKVDLGGTARPIMRERATSSPTVQSARRRDIWDILQSILGQAIQRLVSTNLLKPAVARLLLSMPIHPRTPKQTQAALRAMQHAWVVEEEELIVLPHPAWRGVQNHTVSAASYSDHTVQLLKIFYESSMRFVLKDALESRAACEWILETLWTVAKEKVDEEGPQALELEVQILALRRRAPEEEATALAA